MHGVNKTYRSNLILGVTTIGDLLFSNKITETNDKVEIENVKLKIPSYQRPYKWTTRNINLLIDDISDACFNNREKYRVGTLILHKNKMNKSADGITRTTLDIVDGQQRLISFSIILKCLLKIRVSDKDNQKLNNKSIDFLEEELVLNHDNIDNIINNYQAIVRRFSSSTDKSKSSIASSLCDFITDQCEFVVVITDDLSEAFQFFDSQNARGKELYPHDLLKAYHLREINNMSNDDLERLVKSWESLNQNELSDLFSSYLYRIKEWIKGNKATGLTDKNIDIFKGVTYKDNYPYAQYHKAAYSCTNDINLSKIPFVTGINELNTFQIDSPIIAGKPFFDYASHYYNILADIRDNSKYEGYFINDNDIVKTLDKYYKNGVGNRITRLMFDTAILLYVDRFCPSIPTNVDLEYLDKFVDFVFIWAYSMRAQYKNVGWVVAQNYIVEKDNKRALQNNFNMYKIICEADSPSMLLAKLSTLIHPLSKSKILAEFEKAEKEIDDDGVFKNYLSHFQLMGFLESRDEE